MVDLARLKICFIAGTLGQGGAEKQLFYQIKSLLDNGAQITVVSLSPGDYWEEKIGDLGVSVNLIGRKLPRWVKLIKIINICKYYQPDIIQSQHFYVNFYTSVCARIIGSCELGAIRSDSFHSMERNGKVSSFFNFTIPRAIITNSQKAMEDAIALGKKRERVYYLPNVIDTSEYVDKAEIDDESEIIKVVSFGSVIRHGYEKRLDRFIRVLAQTKELSSKRFVGIVVGSERLWDEHKELASNLGLTSNDIEFRKPIKNSIDLLKAADILVVTSDAEGTPNVILEAMAIGVPVLATRVGGIPGIRGLDSNYLIPPTQEEAISRALASLISDKELRRKIARKARQSIEDHYSIDCLPEKLKKIYSKRLNLEGNR